MPCGLIQETEQMRIRRFSELRRLRTFEERFEYLKLFGSVGEETFGFDRYLNQQFYKSKQWRQARDEVIIRDKSCDLGIEGYEIFGNVRVHHMNPLSVKDVEQGLITIFDPEFLICTSLDTHTFLHFGGSPRPKNVLVVRAPGDTTLW